MLKGMNRKRVFVVNQVVDGVKVQRVGAGSTFGEAGRMFGMSPLAFWLRGHHLSSREARQVAMAEPGRVFSRPVGVSGAEFTPED